MPEPAGETVDPYNVPEPAGETVGPYKRREQAPALQCGSKVSLRLVTQKFAWQTRVLTTAPGVSFITPAPLRYPPLPSTSCLRAPLRMTRYPALQCGRTQFSPTGCKPFRFATPPYERIIIVV